MTEARVFHGGHLKRDPIVARLLTPLLKAAISQPDLPRNPVRFHAHGIAPIPVRSAMDAVISEASFNAVKRAVKSGGHSPLHGYFIMSMSAKQKLSVTPIIARPLHVRVALWHLVALVTGLARRYLSFTEAVGGHWVRANVEVVDCS